MPRKGRRAVKAARAREEALKAERRMGEVLRGKELTEVKEFVEAHSRAQAERREAAFSRFLNGKQVAGELRDWCRGESKLEVALTIMARNCRNCGVIKWRCNCGMFWGEGETQYQPDQTDGFEEEEDETEEDEDEFEIEELAAWIEGTPQVKSKKKQAASPEGANATKQKTGGRRSLFAAK